jgi:hypothetical protein
MIRRCMMHVKIMYSKLEKYEDFAIKALETLATSFYSSNKQPRERVQEKEMCHFYGPMRLRKENQYH